jgi:hypothetical protein
VNSVREVLLTSSFCLSASLSNLPSVDRCSFLLVVRSLAQPSTSPTPILLGPPSPSNYHHLLPQNAPQTLPLHPVPPVPPPLSPPIHIPRLGRPHSPHCAPPRLTPPTPSPRAPPVPPRPAPSTPPRPSRSQFPPSQSASLSALTLSQRIHGQRSLRPESVQRVHSQSCAAEEAGLDSAVRG